MENQSFGTAEQVVAGIQKDFAVVGKNRIGNKYAYAFIIIVLAMAIGMIYVAKQSIGFGEQAGQLAANIRMQMDAPPVSYKVVPAAPAETIKK